MQYVKEVMTKEVKIVDENLPLARAAQIMKDLDIGFLVVGNGSGAVGCLTDRDITINGVARGFDPNQHTVSEVMTTNLLTCESGTKITEATRRMQEHKVKRMVVTDSDDNIVGVFSLGDIASRSEVKPEELSNTFGEIFKTA